MLPCGCLSSVEVALEAAEVAVDLSGIKIDTCGCLCFVELVKRPQELLLVG